MPIQEQGPEHRSRVCFSWRLASARTQSGFHQGLANHERLLAGVGKPSKPELYISRVCEYFWSIVPLSAMTSEREDMQTNGPDHGAACRYGLTAETYARERSAAWPHRSSSLPCMLSKIDDPYLMCRTAANVVRSYDNLLAPDRLQSAVPSRIRALTAFKTLSVHPSCGLQIARYV